MSYFLKQSRPSKKGLYLQIYESVYVKGKGSRNFSRVKLGYASDLAAKGIGDPVAYGREMARKMNEEAAAREEPKVYERRNDFNLGCFLLRSAFSRLGMRDDVDAVASGRSFRFSVGEFLESMAAAQVVAPGSKRRAFEDVLPTLLGFGSYSYDQILDGVRFLGEDYQKYIEVLNRAIARSFGGRKASPCYFDCTNYYFEVDLQDGFRRKGPSKENRPLPLVGQALLLDSEGIPLGMSLYPGNQSEKPEIRKAVEGLRRRFDVKGRIVQVADKGLNCGQNVKAAAVDSGDGYIFSRSVPGLGRKELRWVLNEKALGDAGWHEARGKGGEGPAYRWKECVDEFEYEVPAEGGRGKERFRVTEKRVLTYNPALARKKRLEIDRMAAKARAFSTAKQVARAELGEAAKYVEIVGESEDGEVVETSNVVREDAIERDRELAGYNLIVTSETGMKAEEVVEVYHGLWRIEESFRILKSYLEARPVYVQNRESIHGHFLICYFALTALRLIEIKGYGDAIPMGRIVDAIRDYRVTETREGSYVAHSMPRDEAEMLVKGTGLRKLECAYLTKKDIQAILDAPFPEVF